jgi:membrane associated rhomboid family serine protease
LLANLLGHSIHSPEVQAFLQSHFGFSPTIALPIALREAFAPPYLASAAAGIVLWHTQAGHVIGIGLTIATQDGFASYQASIDRGLIAAASPAQIAQAYGRQMQHQLASDEATFVLDTHTARYRFSSGQLSVVLLSLPDQILEKAAQVNQNIAAERQAERDHPFVAYATIALIAISGLITAVSQFGRVDQWVSPLLIASDAQFGLREVFGGQIWRLLTPMFLHFDIAHLAFNLLWLWNLGGLLERKLGVKHYLTLVAIVSLLANLMQYLLTSSAHFGGMSGVVYGLFGYIWVQGLRNPKFGQFLSTQTIWIMMIWFALCWLNLLGPIANWAHTGGLLAGAGLAYWASAAARRG